MNTPPAIAVFEFDSIPVGVCAADAMVKKARIDVLRIGTVQPGKYIILIGGTVGDVGESRREGLRVGGERVTDEIFLPDVHTQVFAAVGGHRQDNAGDALGIIETSAIPINVAAADKAVKTAQVTIVEIRLGDGLGGKGITMLTGLVHDVQAAIAAGIAIADRSGVTTRHTVIPIQDRELRARIQAATELYPSGDGTRDQPTAGKRASRR
jgi:microcompartment protein CcmL/EutN